MYTFESKVRISEVGEDDRLRVDAMINYLQDCSAFQGEALGIGTPYLETIGARWIIASWDIHIERMPLESEEIRISTWPYKLQGCFGYRNFSIDTKDGERLVSADSLWVMLQRNTLKPMRVPQEIIEAYELSEKIPMEEKGRKIKVPQELEKKGSFFAREADIDVNHHVNNANYLRFAYGFQPKNQELSELRVEYRNAAVLGDEILPYINRNNKELYVVLKDPQGEVYTNIWFAYK